MTRHCIYFLLVPVMLLAGLGLVMQGSISPVMPDAAEKGAYFHFWNHLKWLLVSLGVGGVALLFDYHWLRKITWVSYVVIIGLLIACFIPGIGVRFHGAQRWVDLGMRFQPSELAKLTAILLAAHWCAKHEKYRKTWSYGFVVPLGLVSVIVGLTGMDRNISLSCM